MTTLPLSSGHPVAAAAARLESELSAVAEIALWSMTAAEAGATLQGLTRAKARMDELLLRVLRNAETVGTGLDTGATTTANWWAHTTNTTRAEAHRTMRLAKAMDAHTPVRDTLASGKLLADQAGVIVDAIDKLPDDVAPWVPPAARQYLLEQAVDHDAKALRMLGRRLLEVIDPAAADAEEARRLEAEEADARAKASFTIVDDGHGHCHGRFTIPSLHGQIIKKHLHAIATNSRHAKKAEGEEKPEPPLSRHRMGLAFLDYLETRPADSLPHAGGIPATILVTLDLDALNGGFKAASLDTGGRISASEARRLACRAGIIPVVLGGNSVVLDIGRKRRLHTETQRIALGQRDKGCTAYGCDTPPGLCHAHHDLPWSKGGKTSIENGRLLCPAHHRRIHDPTYQHHLDKHGKVRFSRRT